MKPVQALAEVRSDADAIHSVGWRAASGERQRHTIVRQIDAWSYVGRWWSDEIRRAYRLVETDTGMWIELYCENGAWWVSRTNA